MARPNINRATRRYIQGLKREAFIDYISCYAVECYNDGVRDSFMALLLKLHDEFDFGNDEINKLLHACEPWMAALMSGEDNIHHDGIKQQLISENITCLLDTDL